MGIRHQLAGLGLVSVGLGSQLPMSLLLLRLTSGQFLLSVCSLSLWRPFGSSFDIGFPGLLRLGLGVTFLFAELSTLQALLLLSLELCLCVRLAAGLDSHEKQDGYAYHDLPLASASLRSLTGSTRSQGPSVDIVAAGWGLSDQLQCVVCRRAGDRKI